MEARLLASRVMSDPEIRPPEGAEALALQPTADARSFRRDVTGTVVGKFVGLGATAVQTVLTARFLGPEGRGVVAVVVLIASTAALLLGSGMGGSTVFHVASGRLRARQAAGFSVTFVLLGTAVAALLGVTIATTGLTHRLFPGISTTLLALGIAGVPMILLGNQLRSILQGMSRIRAANLAMVTEPVATVALTGLVLVVLGPHAPAVAAVMLLAAGLAGLVAIQRLKLPAADYRPLVPRAELRSLWRYGRRAHLANTLQFLNYRLDVLIVNALLGPVAVGLYTISTRLAELLWQVPDSMAFVLLPRSSGTGRRTHEATRRAYGLTLIATVGSATFLALSGHILIRVLFGPVFAQSYLPMLVLLPGAVLLGQAKVLSSSIAGRGFPHYNSYIAAVGLVVTVALDVALIPRLGITGAAAATTASYAVISLLSHIVYYQIGRQPKTAGAS